MLDRFLDEWLPAAFGLIILGAVCFFCYVIALGIRDHNESVREARRFWRGATLFRICPDGTRIWRLSDGRFVDTRHWPIEDPLTICPSK